MHYYSKRVGRKRVDLVEETEDVTHSAVFLFVGFSTEEGDEGEEEEEGDERSEGVRMRCCT